MDRSTYAGSAPEMDDDDESSGENRQRAHSYSNGSRDSQFARMQQIDPRGRARVLRTRRILPTPESSPRMCPNPSLTEFRKKFGTPTKIRNAATRARDYSDSIYDKDFKRTGRSDKKSSENPECSNDLLAENSIQNIPQENYSPTVVELEHTTAQEEVGRENDITKDTTLGMGENEENFTPTEFGEYTGENNSETAAPEIIDRGGTPFQKEPQPIRERMIERTASPLHMVAC